MKSSEAMKPGMRYWLAPICLAASVFLLGAPSQVWGANLPIVIIDTAGQTIPADNKIAATMKIIFDYAGGPNTLDGTPNEYNGSIGIEIRGQSSASSSVGKKQFSVETRNPAGDQIDVSILRMPKESDWVLQSNWFDRSSLRNWLAYNLARRMGHYASRTKFAELYLVTNGASRVGPEHYWGLYLVLEKIKRGADRVNVQKREGADLSGGYIFSIDKGDADFETAKHTKLQAIYPKHSNITLAEKDWIRVYMDQFEAALAGPAFTDPAVGYRHYASIDSFVDYLLLDEVTRNIDGLRISTYLHKDKSGLLRMGPAWDFDRSFGNAGYLDGWKTDGWLATKAHENEGLPAPFWWTRLKQDPEFCQRFYDRWFDLRRELLSVPNLMAMIDQEVVLLTDAATRNAVRWPINTDLIPDPKPSSWNQEVSYLKTWLRGRIAWIDENVPACRAPLHTEGRVTLLRVHDKGTRYGSPGDQIDVEAVIELDSLPGKALGFQLRNDSFVSSRWNEFKLLRDAFASNRPVGIDYRLTGLRTGVLTRVMIVPLTRANP